MWVVIDMASRSQSDVYTTPQPRHPHQTKTDRGRERERDTPGIKPAQLVTVMRLQIRVTLLRKNQKLILEYVKSYLKNCFKALSHSFNCMTPEFDSSVIFTILNICFHNALSSLWALF